MKGRRGGGATGGGKQKTRYFWALFISPLKTFKGVFRLARPGCAAHLLTPAIHSVNENF